MKFEVTVPPIVESMFTGYIGSVKRVLNGKLKAEIYLHTDGTTITHGTKVIFKDGKQLRPMDTVPNYVLDMAKLAKSILDNHDKARLAFRENR